MVALRPLAECLTDYDESAFLNGELNASENLEAVVFCG
jgi:hypothetical protein